MTNLTHRQHLIQEKRKQTSRRDFLLEVCSRFPFFPNKEHGKISRYPKTSRIGGLSSDGETVCNSEGITYTGDFSATFGELMSKSYFAPMLHRGENEQVDYADVILNAKQVYLSNAVVGDSQNILYSWSVKHNCADILSSVMVRNGSHTIFESRGCINSSNIFYSSLIQDSSDIRFSDNLINCHHCILCNNSENQSYCIRNTVYTKDEYLLEAKKILEDKAAYAMYLEELGGYRGDKVGAEKTGVGIFRSSDVTNCCYVNDIRYGNNLVLFGSNTECEYIYDCITGGSPTGNHIYAGLSCSGEHIYCGGHCEDCYNVYYSFDIEGCSYCLGCVGLKNKSFCIFNTQYTKEERHEKVDEIFTKMEQEGTLGNFFPGLTSPFYFNDTAAYLIDDSFTKEEVEAKGYLRRDETVKVDIPEGMEVVKVSELGEYEGCKTVGSVGMEFFPSADMTEDRQSETGVSSDPSTSSGGQIGERRIDPLILNKVIQDDEGNVYRIIKMEYDFLMKHRLPLPRKHWLERLKMNFSIA